MKSILISIFLLISTLSFGQKFYAYGNLSSRTVGAGLSRNVTITLFNGGYKPYPDANYATTDITTGMVVWINCTRFPITAIVSTSPLVLTVADSMGTGGLDGLDLYGYRLAILEESRVSSYNIAAFSDIADGNAGTAAGLSPKDGACIQNYYGAQLALAVAGSAGVSTGDKGEIDVVSATDWRVDTNAIETINILDGTIANSDLANMAAATIKGSVAGGVPADLSKAQAQAILSVDDLVTFSGVVDGATNLGTMSQGTQYPDNLNVKGFADSTDAKLTRLVVNDTALITQTAHGFVKGQLLSVVNGVGQKATARGVLANSVVTSRVSDNAYIVQFSGTTDSLYNIENGQTYFTSAIDGEVTTVSPSRSQAAYRGIGDGKAELVFSGFTENRNFQGENSYVNKVLESQPDNIVAYYPMYEPSGTATQDLKNNRNGVLQVAALGVDGIGDGRTGIRFDSATSLMNLSAIGNNFSFVEGGISLWVKLSATAMTDGVQNYLFYFDTGGGSNAIHARESGSGSVEFLFATPNGTIYQYVTLDTNWNNVILTWSQNNQQFLAYKNGVAGTFNDDYMPSPTSTSLARWVIGNNHSTSPTKPAKSAIAHVAIWSDYLTESTIRSLSTLNGVGIPPNPDFVTASQEVIVKEYSTADTLDWIGRADICKSDTNWIMTYRTGETHNNTETSLIHIRLSTDEGATWSKADTLLNATTPITGAPFGYHGATINIPQAIFLKALNGDVLVHVAEERAGGQYVTYQYRSTDDGATWTDEGVFFPTETLNIEDYTVIPSGANAGIYNIVRGGVVVTPEPIYVYRSTNNGTTWTLRGTVQSTIDGNESGLEWLGGDSLLVVMKTADVSATFQYLSTDAGATWGAAVDITAAVGAMNKPILKMIGDTLFMTGRQYNQSPLETRTSVFFSTNKGENWSQAFYPDPHFSRENGYCTMEQRTDGDYYMLSYVGNLIHANIIEYVFRDTSFFATAYTEFAPSALPAIQGGTGQSSYTAGDILTASSPIALTKLPDVATGNVLLSGGVGVVPAYGKVGLTTHVSGILPVANGGTGASSFNPLPSGTAGQTLLNNGSTWVASSGLFDDAVAGEIGLYTAVPEFSMAFGGDLTGRTLGVNRRTAANTAGNALLIAGGGATVGSTDKSGGLLTLRAGTSTGTGNSRLVLQTNIAGSTGTTDNAFQDWLNILNGYGYIGAGTSSGVGRLQITDTYANMAATFCADCPVGYGTHHRMSFGASGIQFYVMDSGDFYDFVNEGAGGSAARLLNTGHLGIGGITSPTGRVHLPAGTTAASSHPLKFTAGVNPTTPEAGGMGWDGTSLTITQTTGPTVKTLAYTTDIIDNSTTNELQTLASTSDATSHTVTLSNSGGSFKIAEGSNITITTTGTGLDGVATIAATGTGDNLGNHSATQDIDMNGFDITEADSINSSDTVIVSAPKIILNATSGTDIKRSTGGRSLGVYGDATWGYIGLLKPATNTLMGSVGYGSGILTGSISDAMSIRSENALHWGANGDNMAFTLNSGRYYSSTPLTDFLINASDSFNLKVGANGLIASTAFTRLVANGIIAFQANHSTGASAMVVPDNAATAYQMSISGGANVIHVNSTNGAEVTTVGTNSSGSTINLQGDTVQINGVDISKIMTDGVWTPTLTGVLNVAASTAYECQWLRVGSTVTFSGKLDLDPTATGTTGLGISLPVASDFTANEKAGGTAKSTSATERTAVIYADATNNRLTLYLEAADTANQSFWFSGSYRIQ